MATLERFIAGLLSESPGLTKREITPLVRSEGWEDLSTRDVNKVLYGNPDLFRSEGHTPPCWSLRHALEVQPFPDHLVAHLDFWPWQLRALEEWHNCGYKGVVEAVTGTGKTRVGIAATHLALSVGRKVAILVPTRDLQNQWIEELNDQFPDREVGLLAGDEDGSLTENDILVATVQTAYRDWILPDGCPGLLIADECHHYGAPEWAQALEDDFEWRLGLTATYERNDRGVEEHLDPYFEGRCYQLRYREALEQDILAHFRIAFLGVRFTPSEQEEYTEANRIVRESHSYLVRAGLEDDLPFAEMMREIQVMAESDSRDIRRMARRYLSAFNRRREALSNARGKLEKIKLLRQAVERADRTILFTQSKKMAEKAASLLEGDGIRASFLHADLKRSDRAHILDQFRKGLVKALAAPRLLDEGLDVPDADLGIVISASRSRRQMIQRMGRILRKKEDGRRASIAILYVEGTSEDPQMGAHEAFIEELTDVADDLEYFTPDQSPTAISWFLQSGN